ncbi:uncharacterized protein [Apostichopus japonicus]|uniref:uncharacterized protein isoform X2 n=1 Tax=Stichopus japonicus TaxID=307972 RepID=UPI003AB543FA
MATSSSGRDKLGSLTKTTIKRSFDYKMCKKVAELTQVVHMLFTKSHEKDLELDLTRKAYEEEITNVVKDGESRIKKMELSLAEQKRRNDIKCSQITLQHEKKLESCMKEYTSKISDLDKEISSLTKQIVSLREELKTYNLSNVKPKSDDNNTSCNVRRASVKLTPVDNVESNTNVNINGNTSNNSNTKQVVEEKHGANSKSSEGYLKQISELEDITRGKDLKIQNLQQLQSTAEEETLKLRDRLLEVELKKEDIVKKFMESEKFRTNQQERIKVLEKELKGQQKEIQKLQSRPRTRSRQSSSPVLSASTENIPKSSVETSYEMDRLKKEIERYRLELSNREGNFNRMFTSTNPVRVDTSLRGLSLGMTRQKSDVSAPNFNPLSHIAGAGRSELRKPRLIDKRLPLLSMEGRSKTSTNLTQHGAAAGNKNFSRKTDMFQQAF